MGSFVQKAVLVGLCVSLGSTVGCHRQKGADSANAKSGKTSKTAKAAKGSKTTAVGGTAAPTTFMLDVQATGNPKYDQFFADVTALAQLVSDARYTLDSAPTTLNTAMNVTDATDFNTSLANVKARLGGKVTLSIVDGPNGAQVAVVPVKGGEALSPEDQALADAYTKVATDVVAIPTTLAAVVAKTADITQQAADLGASAKSDFTGISAIRTVPSVLVGLTKVVAAVKSIRADVPVIVDRSRAMTVAIKQLL